MNPNSNQNQKQEQSADNWRSHPNLNGMDPAKLEMLQNLAAQGSQKNQQDLLPFLMTAASKSRSDGMNFSSQEVRTILEVLKAGKSPQEAAKLDRIVALMSIMRP